MCLGHGSGGLIITVAREMASWRDLFTSSCPPMSSQWTGGGFRLISCMADGRMICIACTSICSEINLSSRVITLPASSISSNLISHALHASLTSFARSFPLYACVLSLKRERMSSLASGGRGMSKDAKMARRRLSSGRGR